MKIATYSDLHLEFGKWDFEIPRDIDADVLVLAGDTLNLIDPHKLIDLLRPWGNKPVLYVSGNHEYYNHEGVPVSKLDNDFKSFLEAELPHVKYLQDEPIKIDGINFFGGTGWTDFKGGTISAMRDALRHMNDYRLIYRQHLECLKPDDTLLWHDNFKSLLTQWLAADLAGPKVVVSHHCPIWVSTPRYGMDMMTPAYCSTDLDDIFEKHSIDLWLFGHIHHNIDQTVSGTRITSNQHGYASQNECLDFDPYGKIIEIDVPALTPHI